GKQRRIKTGVSKHGSAQSISISLEELDWIFFRETTGVPVIDRRWVSKDVRKEKGNTDTRTALHWRASRVPHGACLRSSLTSALSVTLANRTRTERGRRLCLLEARNTNNAESACNVRNWSCPGNSRIDLPLPNRHSKKGIYISAFVSEGRT
ncbi:unnamed protein product, partial [Heterotrigona itama]